MAASHTKNPAGYRLVKTCSLSFWPSTDTRDKRRQSHLLEWDAVLQAHPLICIEKKPLKQAWVLFVAKHEDLRCTGRLHALVHIFVALSDVKLGLRIPFLGMGGRLCRPIGYFVFCTGM